MTTILFAIVGFALCMFFLSIGLIFSKKTRLKKSCSGGLGPHRIDEKGDHLTCGTCSCGPSMSNSLNTSNSRAPLPGPPREG
ncbi:MAG: hypothetical protein GY847_33055 [Proteobacteria bacterium]|nr:hypothetical protein [Pseudomonadota bacterium]